MTRLILTAIIIALAPIAAFAQEQDKAPATSDLGFLVGSWEIDALHYETLDPKAAPRHESGTKTCEYTLKNGDQPAFIACRNESIYKRADEEFPEAYIEYINYNPYVESFEKTNFFSSFPVKVIERVTFDRSSRVVEIRGRVEVANSVDTYVEYWRFDETFSSFKREALINQSSLPITDYRLILSGKGTRANDPDGSSH